MLIAEHSMCQPGRPSPTAVDHDGSPGLGPFHSAKSRTSSLPYSSASTRSPTRIASGSRRASAPVRRPRRDPEEDRAVVGAVRVAALEQRRDEVRDLRDVLGRARQDVRAGHAQRVGVVEEPGRVPVGELGVADPLGGGAADDLVVDVGQVHDPGHAQAAVAQVADQQVGEQERPEVADVRRAVDRRPAAVDPDVAGLDGLERAELAGQRVLEADPGHAAAPRWRRPGPRSTGRRPRRPTGCPVEALTLTAAGSSPSRPAMASRIASRRAPSRGRAPITVTSTLDGRQADRREPRRHLGEQLGAGDAARRPRVGRKQAPEVAQPRGAQQRVGHRVERPRRHRSGRPAGARPATSIPPSRRPVPGPNGWLSCPKPTRAPRRGKRRLDPAQVVGQRHLEVRGCTGDRMDGDSTGLEQGGLVGELGRTVGRERGPRVQEQAPPGALRRLGGGQRLARDRRLDPPVVHPLERLGDGEHRQRRAVRLDGLGHGLHQRGRDQRPRAVVDEDRALATRAGAPVERVQVADARGHRGLAGRPARDHRGHAGRQPGGSRSTRRPAPAP